jgi:D-xylose transport system permease protein
VLALVAVAFVLFMAYRNARSIKDYGLGEANYGGEALKSLVPIVFILAFIWVMNSSQGVPIPVLILVVVALLGAFLTNSTTFGQVPLCDRWKCRRRTPFGHQ